MKEAKSPSSQRAHKDGLLSLADAMKDKNDVKRDELLLRCISQLSDGDGKTKMLLEFLQRQNNNQRTEDKATSEFEESNCNRMPILDLVDEEK